MERLVIIILLLISSCSPQWHIDRAIQKNPSILEKDTVTVVDSVKVVTNNVTHDSVFVVSKDTVTIVKDKLTVRHFINNDSVWIYGECASDTIWEPYRVEVPFETIRYDQKIGITKVIQWIVFLMVLLLVWKFFLKDLLKKKEEA